MAERVSAAASIYVYDEVPDEVNGHAIPDQLALRNPAFTVENDLARRMGILFVKITAQESIAVMPVEGNMQPLGLMHGGAYCVLGETLGSLSARVHAGAGRFPLGTELNATHTGAASTGFVTGVCTAIHLGGTMTVHEIVISDARGRRCSTVRMTNLIRQQK